MLFPPDIRLLKTLKKVQGLPTYYVAINTATKQAYMITGCTLADVTNAFNASEGVPIKLSDAELAISLDYLKDQGCIIKPANAPVYQVTHSGWYNGYVRRKEALSLVLTHVLFPSAVAFITTIITLLVRAH